MNIEFQCVADTKFHHLAQRPIGTARGQKVVEATAHDGTYANPELGLTVPRLLAQHRVIAERAVLQAQAGAGRLVQKQPTAAKLFDLDGHVKLISQHGLQALDGMHPFGETAGVEREPLIVDAVAAQSVFQAGGTQANQR